MTKRSGAQAGQGAGAGEDIPSSPDSSAIISSSVDMPDKYSSSLSMSAVLVVVVWGVGGAAVEVVYLAAGSERGAASLVVVWATEAAIFLFGAGWFSGTVDASAAFRFLVRGGMVAVFGWEPDL